eukprot:CAMPEP_0176366144 /NCGR_PEP_ID=MMETSP0126-20121128/20973_1 /TAXON_ID=141414 ORGANISM="Strombidinopsis acuminatum, Strain SPMC142" /NCGR_SAMPLE_ID=MMETSP0126 /ASSEMBLY_ACC=CAM_ASM_000229 /LENGTH=334 /DNA_ID=CAMNT_0017723445 /DNA_START=434 /DNA_END=1438 /DNA_ORIENTATION=+
MDRGPDKKNPGPSDTKVPTFTTSGPKYTIPREVEKKKSGDDHVGPSFNDPKPRNSAPCFSFGSRFGEDIRAKPHLRPIKVNGPGPGSYKLHDSEEYSEEMLKANKIVLLVILKREWSQLPKKNPAPNAYSMTQHMGSEDAGRLTGYSFPQGSRDDQAAIFRSKLTVGPGSHNTAGPLPFTNGTGKLRPGKSILGGPKGEKKTLDNGFPGPGHYDPANAKNRLEEGVTMAQRYAYEKASDNPGPAHYKANHIAETSKSIKFGTSERPGLIKNMLVPGPDKYNITGDFDFRDQSKNDGKEGGKVPKFCFGMKPNLRAKNLDQPGPGEYEVDFVPMN